MNVVAILRDFKNTEEDKIYGLLCLQCSMITGLSKDINLDELKAVFTVLRR